MEMYILDDAQIKLLETFVWLLIMSYILLFSVHLVSTIITRLHLRKRYKKLNKLSTHDCSMYFKCLLSELIYDGVPYDFRAEALNTAIELLDEKAYRENLSSLFKGSDNNEK